MKRQEHLDSEDYTWWEHFVMLNRSCEEQSAYCQYRDGGSICDCVMDLRAEIDQKDAEIELLKSIVRRHLRYYPATDVMVIRKDMPPMTVEMRKKLVEVCKADSV